LALLSDGIRVAFASARQPLPEPSEATVIDLLKKYFWGLNLIVIGVSAYFAARASLHLLEGALFLDDAAKPGAAARRPATTSPQAKPHRGKDSNAILERNMFCSTCPPIVASSKSDDKSLAGQQVKTSLPLQLIATMVSPEPEWSFAVIKDTQGREEEDERGQKVKVSPFGIYSQGRKLAGHDAVVDHVDERRVYLKVGSHTEYVDLVGVTNTDRTLASAGSSTPAAFAGASSADLQKGVRKVSETQYEIDRNLLEKVLSDTNAIARSARVVPSTSPKDGKPNGFKLFAIKPDSVYSMIGLQNADTVSAINGQELNSPEKAFELYAKLRTASHLQISIVRRGSPMTIDYSIR
jgi:general secretion pathway protein C